MSTRARATFAASCVFCIAAVAGVHQLKNYEESARKVGLAADEERRARMRENVAELDRQQQLRRKLEAQQPVTGLGGPPAAGK